MEETLQGLCARAQGHAPGFLKNVGSGQGSSRLHLRCILVKKGSSHGFMPAGAVMADEPLWLLVLLSRGHLSTLESLLAEQPLPVSSPKPKHLVLSSCPVKQG